MLPQFDSLGKMLIILGTVLLMIGAIMYLGGKFTSLGRLPGDISLQKGNFSFYFPITTSIILSIVVTVILNIFLKR